MKKDYAYVQLAIDGKYDIVIHDGSVIDSLSSIDHLKFTKNLINLEENGYGKNKKT